MVPEIIRRTFQLIASDSTETGRIPVTRNRTAVLSTIQTLIRMNRVIRTYMARNSMIASIFSPTSLTPP